MNPALRETASRVTARVTGSRFAKPLARVVLVAAGLLLLAFIGKTAVAGAMAASASPAAAPSAALVTAAPAGSSGMPGVPAPAPLSIPAAVNAATPSPPSPQDPGSSAPSAHTQATSDDPVILNTASIDDLRRLPGVGEKKATAIVALRTRLGGRFHVVEDLLKVKGIGRATLKRLRPLVRLDPPAQAGGDAGLEPPR